MKYLMTHFVLLSLVACASQGSMERAVSNDLSQIEKNIEETDLRLERMRQKQMHLLAPEKFAEAEEAINEAREDQREGDDISEIQASLRVAQSRLDEIKEISNTGQVVFASVLRARKDAIHAGATQFEEFMEADEEFKEASKMLMNRGVAVAQDERPELIKNYRDLELKAIQQDLLGDARRTIDQALKEGAENRAPRTLSKAREELHQAERFIAENPYERIKAKKKADQALFSANHLLKITRLTEEIAQKSLEEAGLWFESTLRNIANVANLEDGREYAIETQESNIKERIKAYQQRNNFLSKLAQKRQSRISNLYNQIASLQAETRKESRKIANLQEEIELEQTVAELRELLPSTDAEIWQRGNEIVIRLKGLNFPTNKATIQPQDFTLLGKVQEGIKMFNVDSMRVIGHTDIRGPEQFNDKLSLDRAEAVKKYLVSQGPWKSHQIETIGKGFRNPLLPNRTPAQMEKNRRVDIILTPSSNQ